MENLEKVVENVNIQKNKLLNLIKEAKTYDSKGILTTDPLKKEYNCDCYSCQVCDGCDCVCQQTCDAGPCNTTCDSASVDLNNSYNIKYLG